MKIFLSLETTWGRTSKFKSSSLAQVETTQHQRCNGSDPSGHPCKCDHYEQLSGEPFKCVAAHMINLHTHEVLSTAKMTSLMFFRCRTTSGIVRLWSYTLRKPHLLGLLFLPGKNVAQAVESRIMIHSAKHQNEIWRSPHLREKSQHRQ